MTETKIVKYSLIAYNTRNLPFIFNVVEKHPQLVLPFP